MCYSNMAVHVVKGHLHKIGFHRKVFNFLFNIKKKIIETIYFSRSRTPTARLKLKGLKIERVEPENTENKPSFFLSKVNKTIHMKGRPIKENLKRNI